MRTDGKGACVANGADAEELLAGCVDELELVGVATCDVDEDGIDGVIGGGTIPLLVDVGIAVSKLFDPVFEDMVELPPTC